jgi:peroxiredoxin
MNKMNGCSFLIFPRIGNYFAIVKSFRRFFSSFARKVHFAHYHLPMSLIKSSFVRYSQECSQTTLRENPYYFFQTLQRRKDTTMPITVGQNAPDFALKTKNSEGPATIKLSDYQGKNVVLLFFPMAFTGVCTNELCSVSGGLELYSSLNAQVFGISVDSPFTLEVFAQKSNIAFPLLSDFNKEASRAYDALYGNFVPGVWDLQGVSKRSAFVIDKDGVVQYAEVLENAGELPNFSKIEETLKSLN